MRDAQGLSLIRDVARDLRYGARMLARSPAFTVTAVLSLGLGVGANTAMFAAVDALMLKRLQVRDADELVFPTPIETAPFRQESIPYPRFELMSQRMTPSPYASVAAIWTIDRSNLMIDLRPGDRGVMAEDPSLVRVGLASGEYFSTLGVNPILGRIFTRDDNRAPGGHTIAVISHAFWQRRLGGDPQALGRTFRLNAIPYEIIGITPTGFAGEWVGMPTDLWVPFMMASEVMPEVPGGPSLFPARVVARLAPALSIEQARAQATSMYRQISRDDTSGFQPPDREERIARTVLELDPGARGYSPQRRAFSQSFAILMGGVGLLLVITCANLANLLLARSAARQREMALRLAIGAGRGRLVRQLLTESALVAIGGGVAGLVIAVWATQALSALFAPGPVSLGGQGSGLTLNLALDGRAVAFAGVVCLLCTLLIGVAPALSTRRLPLSLALRDSGTRVVGRGKLRGPSAALLVAQVALSLVLLIGAGLFTKTLRNLKTADLGVQRNRELFIWSVPGQTGRQDDAVAAVWKQSQDRLSRLPGVVAVGAGNQAVLSGTLFVPSRPGVAMTVEGEPPKPTSYTGVRVFITPHYFDALGVPFLAGRDFTERDDENAPLAVIINESMARFYFGSPAASIGRLVRFSVRDKGPTEVVGVIKDHVRGSPRGTGYEFNTYFSYRHPEALNRGAQSRLRIMMVAIKTSVDPLTIAAAARQELHAIDPLIPILRINTVEQQLDDVLAQDWMIAGLSDAFGGLAILLVSLGLFGLVSYRVALRITEIGVRLALGSTRSGVLGMILRESLALIGAGMCVGLVAALALTTVVSARLYGVSPTDPWTIGGAVVVLIAVGALAAFVPARRAASVDPMVSLRCE